MPSIPPLLDDESARMAALRELVVLDSEPEPVFDAIARLASEVCGVPIALLSLVDTERQWFKANVGLPGVNETPRDVAFCAHAIGSDAVFEVPDAALDPRFAANPLVTGVPDIRFYAGAPLVLPHGERVGTLCVIDREARSLGATQLQMLRSLADIATGALVMRRDLINRSLAVRSEYEKAVTESEQRYRAIVDQQSELVSLADVDGQILFVNPAYARQFGHAPEQMVGLSLYDFVQPSDRDMVRSQIAEVFRSGASHRNENRMRDPDGVEKWVAWTNHLQHDAARRPVLHSVGRDITERKQAELALRASQTFLYRTGRVAGVGGWEVDLASGAMAWSEETRRIHEVAADYVPDLDHAISFYAPEARPLIQAALEAGMRDGQPWDMELPLITATGRHIWVRAVGEVEFAHGQAVRLVGAFQDITERKHLEQKLAENELFIRQVTDSIPLRIAYVDSSLRFRFVNKAHCERYGRPRDEILGRTREELVGEPLDAAMKARVEAVLAGAAQRFDYEECLGSVSRRIESHMVPDIGASGEVRGFFTTGVDITARSVAERALRDLTAIFDNTTDYVVQSDRRGDVTYMNPALRCALGMHNDAPLGQRNFAEFNTPETKRLYSEVIMPAVVAQGVWTGQATVYVADRREIPISHMVIAHRDATGGIERYSAVMRDISAEVQAGKLQQHQTATLRSITEAIPDIVAVVGADGRYRFVNTSFERWCGATRESIVGRTLVEIIGRTDYERSLPWVERALRGETVRFERAYTGRSSAAHLSITYIPLWLQDGSVDGFVALARDSTQQKQEEVRLLHLSQRDTLTGLLNRAGFEQQLDRWISEGNGASLALLYIDLDHFKPVNDQHGHPVGDQVLLIFSQRLQKLVRPSDLVARLGGDEFAIVLAGVRDSADAHAVAAKVVAAAHAPFGVGKLQLRIGASVGVALGADPATGWPELVARADALLYQAKASGRGRHIGAAP